MIVYKWACYNNIYDTNSEPALMAMITTSELATIIAYQESKPAIR